MTKAQKYVLGRLSEGWRLVNFTSRNAVKLFDGLRSEIVNYTIAESLVRQGILNLEERPGKTYNEYKVEERHEFKRKSTDGTSGGAGKEGTPVGKGKNKRSNKV